MDLKSLRALLERASLPACETRLCEAGPLPWPAWYVMPVAATISRDGERIAEIMWDGPGLWNDAVTKDRTAARAELFAAVPEALPALVAAAEQLELVQKLHADYVRASEENAARGAAAYLAMTKRAEQAEERAERLRLIADEDAGGRGEAERRALDASARERRFSREAADLRAVLETRNAELDLAQEKVRELEAELEAARRDLGATVGETLREAAQRSKGELDMTVNQIAPLFQAVRDEHGAVETARFFDAAMVATRRAGELLTEAAAACDRIAAEARVRRAASGQDGPAKYGRARLAGEQKAAEDCAAAVRSLIPAGGARGG